MSSPTNAQFAEQFAGRFREECQYCPERGYWLVITPSSRWEEDIRDASVIQRMIHLMRSTKNEDCTNLDRIKCSLETASSHPLLILNERKLDANPDVVCSPGGTLDLRTALVRPSAPTDYHTRSIAVSPTSEDDCPRWHEHLEWALQGNSPLIAYLQRWAGYMLTGKTDSQSYLLPYGNGRNGKDVIFDTLRELMGGYARTAPEGLFTSKDGETSEYATAAVSGVRFVYQGEIPEGHRLNENQVKMLTGNRQVDARFPYGRPFTYRPALKPVIVCNRKPDIRGTDDGIWDRTCPLPFRNYVSREDRDLGLIDYLIEKEGSGIMAWAMNGAMFYYEMGLNEPEEVTAERLEYRGDVDTLGTFLAEHVEPREGGRLNNSALYDTFRGWCALNLEGEDCWSQRKLSQRMKARGYVQVFGADDRYWKGYVLK